MQILFDHIVLFVDDLDESVDYFREKDFHVVYGGSHPMWGTYNALIYIGKAYLELIAIEKEHVFKNASLQPYTLHETYAINERANGYTRFALRTNQSSGVADLLKSANFDVHGPEQFSRNTRSGDTVRWQMVHAGVHDRSTTLPFIIQWDIPDDVRFASLRAQNIIAPHTVGNVNVSEVHIHEGDLQQLAVFYEALHIPIIMEEKHLTVELGETKVIYYSERLPQTKIVFKNADHSSEFTFDQTVYTIEQ
jgi:catechol 2,3-dioxygenase-like lactoylglutathione lyase family enzyme